MTDKSNNPPDVILELTAEEAAFIMGHCNSNMTMGLKILQEASLPREGLEKIVEIMEQFKVIRNKLIAQGVVSK